MIDKTFVLNFALSRLLQLTKYNVPPFYQPICFFRESEPFIWKEIIPHVDMDDLPGLLNNKSCLLYILGNRRILKHDLFVRAKTFFFDSMAVETLGIDEVCHAHVVIDFSDLLR